MKHFQLKEIEDPFGRVHEVSVALEQWCRRDDGTIDLGWKCVTKREIDFQIDSMIMDLERVRKQAHRVFEKKYAKRGK